ncbi:hypothetical protein BTZ20_5892 [Rhodococcus sp. MTM3W5.2]|nr:hypothetical protein BTZ20_5892 [Rhodococcus sp. MTM3W5.2]
MLFGAAMRGVRPRPPVLDGGPVPTSGDPVIDGSTCGLERRRGVFAVVTADNPRVMPGLADLHL